MQRTLPDTFVASLRSAAHYCAANLLLSLLFSTGGHSAGPPLPVDPLLALRGPPPLPVLNLPDPPQLAHVPSSSVVVTEGIPPVPQRLIAKIRRWEFVDLSQLLRIRFMGLRGCSGSSMAAASMVPRLSQLSIAVKELIPVVLAAATFGRIWPGKIVQFVVDNKAVVSVLNSIYSKEVHIMHLVRLLVFFAARYNFWFSATHIPG